MTPTMWLASYPKSGNTWFRMLIANLASKDGEPVDINALPEPSGIASSREAFDQRLLIASSLLTHDEVDCLRPRLYEEMARTIDVDLQDEPETVPPMRFVKVHDAYTLTPLGEPLLAGSSGAVGAIVIVRDPRDVAHSLAVHINSSIDEAITFMNNREATLSGSASLLPLQLRHKLLSWSDHIASWLDQSDIPVHLVRYEDLRADTFGCLARAMQFAGYPTTIGDLRRAVEFADFTRLQKQEHEKGFREVSWRAREPFFRRGVAGAWREELGTTQVARIEAAHASMMRKLGYT